MQAEIDSEGILDDPEAQASAMDLLVSLRKRAARHASYDTARRTEMIAAAAVLRYVSRIIAALDAERGPERSVGTEPKA